MGSRSKSRASNRTSSRTTHRTSTSTRNYDNRDFSDRRNIRVDDRDVDKRAVLKDATQIMDSIYVNVDPSDQALKSVVLAWQRSTHALLEARRFDVGAATALLGEVIRAAENGMIAVTAAHMAQMRSWQDQLNQQLDFAAASLATGERLIESAGHRQASISERILDLAAGAVGQTSDGQIRLLAWTLFGVAGVVWAARYGKTG